MTLNAQKSFRVSVTNQGDTERKDIPVVLNIQKYKEVRTAEVKLSKELEVPCQLDDLNGDGIADELCFMTDLKAGETKRFAVTLSNSGEQKAYESRVYAEMLIRNDKVKEKNRHNNYIESITARGDCANPYNLQHHHGVCFESELNGIRIYFDKRQTLDLYGKFKKRLELEETQFYTSAAQKEDNYGDDVLWVGNTFGLGAFRGWNGTEPTMIEPVRSRTQRIVSYGPLRTIVEVEDRGWKAEEGKSPIDMTIRYTQYAGHRDTDVDIFFNKNVSNYHFSTGLIDIKGSDEFSDQKGLRACWGTDWPAGDTVNWKRETVGLAICLDQKNIEREIARDSSSADKQGNNLTFIVGTSSNRLSYKVAYCSANEEFGFLSKSEWFEWVKAWKRETSSPIIIKYKSSRQRRKKLSSFHIVLPE
jgi:hypothetical protein